MAPEQRVQLFETLKTCATIYERGREDEDLWKHCEGKENFRSISSDLGFSDNQTAEKAIFVSWSRDDDLLSEVVKQIRNYINGL